LNDYGFDRSWAQSQSDATTTNAFLNRVFSWMFAGLLLTAIVGWYVAESGLALSILRGGSFFVLFLAQLGLVWYLSARVDRLQPGTATALFLGYSALSGMTFSTIFLRYTTGSILQVFGMTALLFGVLAVIGATTKMDLRKVGTVAFAGLVTIIIASLLNVFLFHSPVVTTILSVVGVAVFSALTAYDMQRLTQYAAVSGRNDAADHNVAIVGALALYLDFINLFLFLLRLFGGGGRR
jgi:uncharacterized protein